MKNLNEKTEKILKSVYFCIFVAAELAIYITFICMESAGNYDTIMIKYAGILICLAAAAVGCLFYGKDGLVLTCALVFTAISDLFILVMNKYYEIGVTTFIVVQTIHFLRIYLINGRKPYISLGIRFGLATVILIILGATGKLNALTGLVAVYLPMLTGNVAESIFLYKKSLHYILYAVGLFLFLCCDICVGLDNFAMMGITLPEGLKNFVGSAIWIFYLPSQVLIVLSAKKTEYPFFLKKAAATENEE